MVLSLEGMLTTLVLDCEEIGIGSSLALDGTFTTGVGVDGTEMTVDLDDEREFSGVGLMEFDPGGEGVGS